MNAINFQTYGLLGAVPVCLVRFVGFLMCQRSYRDRPTTALLTGAAILLTFAARLVYEHSVLLPDGFEDFGIRSVIAISLSATSQISSISPLALL